MSERTPTPWAYRPKKYDGWGFIRGADGDVACVARGETSETHDAHRAAGTDPYGPNAAFIVKAVNNHDALVKALTELSHMYTHAWDRVDGGLTMFGSSVDRFEKAHRDAHVLLCTIKGEPLPVDLDEDDTDLVSAPGESS